jgi:glycosyltransferase involved in cell wall biosynthesis
MSLNIEKLASHGHAFSRSDSVVEAQPAAQNPKLAMKKPMLPPPDFEMPTVTVVIPTLNEAKNLPLLLPRIPIWIYEIIIVDGRSTDDTVGVARALRPDVSIVMETRRGKGAALRAGFQAASGDIIVTMDADGSMDPAEIVRFVAALMSGSAFAKGSRFIQGGGTHDMSIFRMLGNWGLMHVGRVLCGGEFSDLCYGYNAFWRHNLPHLDYNCDGFEIETALCLSALRSGLKICEVPSFESERNFGESNLKAIPDGLRVLRMIVALSLGMRNRQRPPHNSEIAGIPGE